MFIVLSLMSGDVLFFFSLEILTLFILYTIGLVGVGGYGFRGVVSEELSYSDDGGEAGGVDSWNTAGGVGSWNSFLNVSFLKGSLFLATSFRLSSVPLDLTFCLLEQFLTLNSASANFELVKVKGYICFFAQSEQLALQLFNSPHFGLQLSFICFLEPEVSFRFCCCLRSDKMSFYH